MGGAAGWLAAIEEEAGRPLASNASVAGCPLDAIEEEFTFA